MLYSTKTASQKRRDLRALLTPGAARPFPGAFTPLSVALIQEKGFPGVYISGAVIANELGLPDVGLTTLDRKSTRLNSSHVAISYAVFCLKKKKPERTRRYVRWRSDRVRRCVPWRPS